jgi:acyl-coenzyme A synthetase/AMP-(fatty) acid ligase/thioesterase domain-containing protein/acyl carrier protein
MTPNDEVGAQHGPADFASVVAGVVARSGDAIAVGGPSGRVTYRELDDWSDAIAVALLDAVGPGDEPVLILAGHDLPAVAAFLGVAKCARPVVVLDSTTPAARMRMIAEGAGPIGTLHTPGLRQEAEEIGAIAGRLIPIPERDETPHPFDRLPVHDDAPLSIVFTSGSTGRPKGVIIGSTAFTTMLLSMGVPDDPDRVLCPVPLSFVFGLGLLARTLATGGQLHLHDPRVSGIESLVERIDADRITLLGSTPYVVRSLGAATPPGHVFSSIRSVTLGGEAVLTRDIEIVRRLTGPDALIVNQLGSTEAWGVANLPVLPGSVLPDQVLLPVGAPSPGREVLLIAESGEIVTGPGSSGVIHVIGEHMSAGYWRDPEATAARFRTLEDGRRSYNTGDIGRWNDRGQLEYVGRADYMVKVRGYLVEPAEVESHIRTEGEVEDVVVVGRPSPRNDGTTSLVAYVVPAASGWISGAALRRRLSVELPTYMVPAQVVELAALPRNPNGKVDRARLPEPAAPAAPSVVRKYEYEEAIADVAAAALGLEGIGVDDDLFELGLDSLAVEEMVAVLEEQLDLQITSATIMEHPTARQLAGLPHREASHLVDGILTTIAAGHGTPIFALSGAGGLALQLRELAQQLRSGRPVHGIQGYGLEGRALPDVSIAQMARRYLRTIRRYQPHGPYTLLGHSLGAVVALEVARRLVEAGETVAYLGLLDPPDTSTVARTALFADLAPSADDSDPSSPLGRARAALTARYPFATRSFWRRARSSGRFRAWFEAGGSAAQRYRLRRPLALRGVYAYLAEGTPSSAVDGWFTPAAKTVRVPGDHLSMLRRPFVSELAREVSQHIRQAAADQEGTSATQDGAQARDDAMT